MLKLVQFASDSLLAIYHGLGSSEIDGQAELLVSTLHRGHTLIVAQMGVFLVSIYPIFSAEHLGAAIVQHAPCQDEVIPSAPVKCLPTTSQPSATL